MYKRQILLYPGANAAALDPMQALEGCGAGDWLLVQNETAGTGDVFREAVRRKMCIRDSRQGRLTSSETVDTEKGLCYNNFCCSSTDSGCGLSV